MRSRPSQVAHIHCAIVFVLMVLFAPTLIHAQDVRGKISGKVLDPNKAAVPGAQVKITDVARNSTVTLTTNDDGFFQANYLLSGTYQVVVETAGFKRYIKD